MKTKIVGKIDSFLYQNIINSSFIINFKYYIIPLISILTAVIAIELLLSMIYIFIIEIIPENKIVDTILVIALSFPSSIVFGRFIFRCLPLQYKINTNYFSGIIRISIACIIVLLTIKIGDFNQLNEMNNSIRIGIFLLFQILVIKRWLKLKKGLYPSKYVLFLRRFNGIADTSLFYTISKALPKGIPIILLTDPDNRSETWDPFLIGFAGIKFFSPLKSIPIYIESDSIKWERTVHDLVENATLIIFDITNNSTSMETEKNIISQYNTKNKSIFLMPVSLEMENKLKINDDKVFKYSMGYFNSFIRLLIGLFILFLTILLIPTYFGFDWSDNEEFIFYSAGGLSSIFFWKKNISNLSSIQLTQLIRSFFNIDNKVTKIQIPLFNRFSIINMSFKELSIQIQIDRIKRSLLYLILVAFLYNNESSLADFIFVKKNIIIPSNIYFLILLLIGVFSIIRLSFSKNCKVMNTYISEYLNNYKDFKETEISDFAKIRIESLTNGYLNKFFNPHSMLIWSFIIYLFFSIAIIMENQNLSLPPIMFLSPILIIYLGIVPFINYIESLLVLYKFKKFRISEEEFYYLLTKISSSNRHKFFMEKIFPLIMHQYIIYLKKTDNMSYKDSFYRKFIKYYSAKINSKSIKIISIEDLFKSICTLRKQFNTLVILIWGFFMPMNIFLLYFDISDSLLANFYFGLFFIYLIFVLHVILKKLVLQKQITTITNFRNYESLLSMIDDKKWFFKYESKVAKEWVYKSYL